MGQQLQLAFDYAALDSETCGVVQQRTGEIKERMRRAAQDIIEIGQRLIEVKQRLGHGRFGQWLAAEFEWDTTTAWRFMNVAGKFCNLQDMKIGASALYLLAAPSTPEGARDEALTLAGDGQTITYSAAQDIRARHLAAEHHADPLPFTPEPSVYNAPAPQDIYQGGWDDDDETIWNEAPAEAEPPPDDWFNRPSLQAMHPAHRVLHSNSNTGGTNEWYTPAVYVEAAHAVMGAIDLDPASCAFANQTVRAAQFFAEADDGYQQPWSGRIWMNPPYGRDEETNQSNQSLWIRKLIAAYTAGEVEQAIILINAVTDRKWFGILWDYPICFTGRVYFYNETITRGSPTHGSAIIYLGSNIGGFIAAYRPLGRLVIPRGWWSESLEAVP